LHPIPNPQSPIPNPQSPWLFFNKQNILNYIFKCKDKIKLNKWKIK